MFAASRVWLQRQSSWGACRSFRVVAGAPPSSNALCRSERGGKEAAEQQMLLRRHDMKRAAQRQTANQNQRNPARSKTGRKIRTRNGARKENRSDKRQRKCAERTARAVIASCAASYGQFHDFRQRLFSDARRACLLTEPAFANGAAAVCGVDMNHPLIFARRVHVGPQKHAARPFHIRHAKSRTSNVCLRRREIRRPG